MKEQDQIKAIAELDGWTDVKYHPHPADETWEQIYAGIAPYKKILQAIPPYLTSRDAIVPVIENGWAGKFPFDGNIFVNSLFEHGIKKKPCCKTCDALRVLKATPSQLCEALLRETGKWG